LVPKTIAELRTNKGRATLTKQARLRMGTKHADQGAEGALGDGHPSVTQMPGRSSRFVVRVWDMLGEG
jgi:hypothetical protein